jgi:hypothetical protein
MVSSRPSDFALTSQGPVRLYSTTELLRLPPPKWLIEGVLPAGGFVGVYGPPASGKSFLAIDLALSVSVGGQWQGHDCGPGAPVLYISAEGGTGIGKRAYAWLLARGVKATHARMMWLIEPIPLYSESNDVGALLGRIEEVETKPAMVVIDTLARCLEGDENTQEDMGRFVTGVDKLRREWGATALTLHHTRLDGDRERGSTAFRGASDTMIAVEGVQRPHGRGLVAINVECTKQRDAPGFDKMRLKVLPVEGTESCVVDTPRRRTATLDEAIIAALTRSPQSVSHLLKVSLRSVETSKAAVHRALVRLKLSGDIYKTSDDLWSVSLTKNR